MCYKCVCSPSQSSDKDSISQRPSEAIRGHQRPSEAMQSLTFHSTALPRTHRPHTWPVTPCACQGRWYMADGARPRGRGCAAHHRYRCAWEAGSCSPERERMRALWRVTQAPPFASWTVPCAKEPQRGTTARRRENCHTVGGHHIHSEAISQRQRDGPQTGPTRIAGG